MSKLVKATAHIFLTGIRIFALVVAVMVIVSGCGSRTTVITTQPTPPQAHKTQPPTSTASDVHLEQGKKMYFKMKYKQAAKHFMQSISKNNQNWESYYYLGLCQQKTGRYDQAIGSFNSSLKNNPPDRGTIARLQFFLGKSWEEEGYLHKAREKFEMSIRLDAEYTPAQVGIQRVDLKISQSENKPHKKGKGVKSK